MAHPKVLEAAVVGLALSAVVRAAGAPRSCSSRSFRSGGGCDVEIREFLSERVAKWWLPDGIVFMDELPKTSVGKFAKTQLREQLKEDALPGRVHIGAEDARAAPSAEASPA